MVTSRHCAITVLLVTSWLSGGCADRGVEARHTSEIERLKQENARLASERDAARAELEKLRAGATAVAPAGGPATPTATTPFTDIETSSAREEIGDLTRLGVFEGMSGAFEPGRPITRAEFVRWLVRANNAIRPQKEIHPAEGGTQTFADVPPSHPDFRYIQGVANAGISIGYDATTFHPDQTLSREELISMKCGVDQGGLEQQNQTLKWVKYYWKWTDADQIHPRYYDAMVSEHFNDAKNVDRTFGPAKMLRPRQPVTRAEAALCIWSVGDGSTIGVGKNNKTAAEAVSAAKP